MTSVCSINFNQHRPIAPAPNSYTTTHCVMSMNNLNIQSNNGYKKKYNYSPYSSDQPPSVLRRNERERNRVKQVNNGFAELRQHIPPTIITELTNGGRGASKKLSKVDTLRLAVEYIRRLKDLIEDVDSTDDSCSISSQLSFATSSQSIGSPIDSNALYYPESPEPAQYQIQCQNLGSSNSSTSEYSSESSPVSQHNELPQFKYEPYDQYDQFCYNEIRHSSTDDEELLDNILSWQEQ